MYLTVLFGSCASLQMLLCDKCAGVECVAHLLVQLDRPVALLALHFDMVVLLECHDFHETAPLDSNGSAALLTFPFGSAACLMSSLGTAAVLIP